MCSPAFSDMFCLLQVSLIELESRNDFRPWTEKRNRHMGGVSDEDQQSIYDNREMHFLHFRGIPSRW